MNNQEAELLIRKFLNGQCTDEEYRLVAEWYRQTEADQMDPAVKDYSEMKGLILNELLALQQPKRISIKKNWYKFAAAAVVLFVMSIGLIIYINERPSSFPAVQFTKDILPGKNTATLTLTDGSIVNLSEVKVGNITNTTAIELAKTAEDLLIYGGAKTKTGNIVLGYHTLQTPVGGQFSIILGDGTRVWLNASSSLKFPVSFSEKERRVELIGEGYFEVSKNREKPFKVYSKGQMVEVLGTRFNLNSYKNEPVTLTTLLEGKIEVSNSIARQTVVPGQQAIQNARGSLWVQSADTNRELAWKNGIFDFKAVDIHYIMRQLSRWYNIQVTYQGTVAPDLFTGKINKNNKLSETLKILSNQNIHFKIEGKKIIVMP